MSEGSDDENHGNLGETKVSEVPIGESFNDASLSKIVSYVLSYMQHDSLVFERKGNELNATGNGNRENGGRLGFANPATRGSPNCFRLQPGRVYRQ